MRPLPILFLPLLALSCSDRDAPKPVPVPDSDTSAPAAAVDPDDPAEPGIPDLARLARCASGGRRAGALPRAQWPRQLTGHVESLAPHRKAVTMAPAPSDGSYEPAYAYGGRPDGQPAP